MKGVLIVVGSIVFALVLAGGGFFAGVTVGKAQGQAAAQDAQTNFFRQRGFDPNAIPGGAAGGGIPGGFPGGTAGGAGAGAGAARRGVTGTIQKVDGNTLTVTSAQNETVTVQIADTTPIQKTITGGKADLTVGATVLVVGERSGSNITATAIQLTDGAAGLGGLFGGGGGGGGGRAQGTPTP
ncbi:MAG: hypothetical protein ABI847_20855 [Anaerolineales bacterium]